MRNKNKRILLPAQYLKTEKDKTETFNEELLSLGFSLFVCLLVFQAEVWLFFKVIILKSETNGKVK